jgi:hypothetical protein
VGGVSGGGTVREKVRRLAVGRKDVDGDDDL